MLLQANRTIQNNWLIKTNTMYISILQEQMMRKKAVQNLDSRQKTMIDNAFYYTNPPDRPKVRSLIKFALNF